TILGMSVGSLIGGTVVIENLFGIPGIGQFLVDSIRAREYPVVQGTVLMIGFFVVIANKLSDLVVLFLDPKERYKRPARITLIKKHVMTEASELTERTNCLFIIFLLSKLFARSLLKFSRQIRLFCQFILRKRLLCQIRLTA